MNPFEVNADPDDSYGAVNSNSITRFSAELNQVPVSADVFDQTFMDDVGATSIESMIQEFSAGAGYSTADPSEGAGAQPGDRVSHGYMQLRGLNTPIMQRDALMPVGSYYNPGSTGSGMTSNFDTERVEIINGPQSLLYSGGGAGGVINVVSKQARLGRHAFGSVQYRLDQYGSKMGLFDYGAGNDRVAVRISALRQSQKTRRINIGGVTNGLYAQIALKLLGNTTLRLSGEKTTNAREFGTSASLVGGSSSADARTNESLHYLLATNQTGADTTNPANGQPNANGAILNGLLNWGNVDSFRGWWGSAYSTNKFVDLTADTRWNPWLSSQLAIGYNSYAEELQSAGSFSFYGPNSPSNPLGGWTAGATPPGDTHEPSRVKALRFSVLADNSYFGGRAHGQTIVGGDFVRTDAAQIAYAYFLADADFNAVVNPAVKTNNGRTLITRQYWSIDNGPVEYPYFAPRSEHVTIGGQNYVYQIQNLIDPSLVSPANPLGTTNTGTYALTELVNKGFYAANFSHWLHDRLTTLAGVRYANTFAQTVQASGSRATTASKTTSFNLGLDYALLPSLRPYVSVSDSYNPPTINGHDPAADTPRTGHGLGEEVGLKFGRADGRLSGSLALFHVDSKNEQYQISSDVTNAINPSGLNGRTTAGNYINVNRTSSGLQFLLTANPTHNWRMRFNAAMVDGTILTTKRYAQYYNDQFYTDAQGEVTYSDGTVVWVPAKPNSKAPTVAPGTAGASPLTLAMMNNPNSAYWAHPANPSGAINKSSAAATVLKSTSPTHGAILTGAIGLPISALQITPNFTLPGSILAAQSGDSTAGYPEFSANFTNLYTFDAGWMKGIQVGGTVSASWRNRRYYYYPDGYNGGAGRRELLMAPNLFRLDLILGYTRRFSRVTFTSRVNVSNLFNHYKVVLLPDINTGWTEPTQIDAAFFGQPRTVVWTNTIHF